MNPLLYLQLAHAAIRNGQSQQSENLQGCSGTQLTSSNNWIQLMSIDYFIQQEQNTHPTQAHDKHSLRQNTFWSIMHHKIFKRTKITQHLLPDYPGIKLKRMVVGIFQNTWRLNNTLFFVFIAVHLQLSAFSPHPSTPTQPNPPPCPTSTFPLGFIHVSLMLRTI